MSERSQRRPSGSGGSRRRGTTGRAGESGRGGQDRGGPGGRGSRAGSRSAEGGRRPGGRTGRTQGPALRRGAGSGQGGQSGEGRVQRPERSAGGARRAGAAGGPAQSREPRLIEGRNPVLEALRAGTRVYRIWVAAESDSSVDPLLDLAQERSVPVERVDRDRVDAMATTPVHQGVVAHAAPLKFVELEDLLAIPKRKGEEPLFLFLDHIEDPQNLGSLIRTADGAGVHGVVIPDRRAAGITPAVGKASAGAIEHVPIARVGNLVRAMEAAKEAGIWLYGAHMEADRELHASDVRGPAGIVVGAEGKGLSRLAAERCDVLVRIPMFGKVDSLNASVAGALLMYEIVRTRSAGAVDS